MTPSIFMSLRDVGLVARFELLRAIRTWQGLAVIVLYVIASMGTTYLFISALGEVEHELATSLGVPQTETPGAMLDVVIKDESFRQFIGALIGDESLVDNVLKWSPITTIHLWTNLLMVPFLATFVSADAISVDLRSRALRFELLRTGRLELVSGRFLGQAILCGVAGLFAAMGAGAVALLAMVGNDPLWLAVGLVWAAWRSWVFGLPFLGLGLAMSQLTASPAWARILALVGTAGSWIAYGLLQWTMHTKLGWLVAPLAGLFPQTWMRLLWEGGGSAWVATGYFAALGLTWMALGHALTRRRDA